MSVSAYTVCVHPWAKVREYRGRIAVWENGRFLWSKDSEIRSVTKEDAQADAERMRAELLAENGL